MSDYAPFANTVALEAMPVVAPDVTGANITHGTDAQSTAPANRSGAYDLVTSILSFNQPEVKKRLQSDYSKTAPEEYKTLIWSVILVVVGLMLLSRGFGLIGEEGENVVVNLSDPLKYPGIGHAIQGMKKGKK